MGRVASHAWASGGVVGILDQSRWFASILVLPRGWPRVWEVVAAMTLALLRDLFRDESLIEHLTASAPPVVRQVIERSKGYEILEEQEPADQIGRSLSAAMVTLIGGVEEDGAAYGPRYPLRRALAEFDRMCRRRHRLPTWRDHAAEPLCSVMLYAIVQDGATILWCSDTYKVPYPRAERLVDSGAAFVWNRILHWDHLRAEIPLDPDCVMCMTRKAPFHLDEGGNVPPNVIHLAPAM